MHPYQLFTFEEVQYLKALVATAKAKGTRISVEPVVQHFGGKYTAKQIHNKITSIRSQEGTGTSEPSMSEFFQKAADMAKECELLKKKVALFERFIAEYQSLC